MKSKILLNKEKLTKWPKCDAKGCNKDGMFKAPKNKNLNEYFNFCEKHVSEYNKNWNFYEGMTPLEIEYENNRDIYKRNPTWNFGLMYFNNRLKNIDSNNLFDEFLSRYGQKKRIDKSIETALNIMDLSYPLTVLELKKQYKKLVKKYHPDLSKNEKDKKLKEDKFKQIINAYQKLNDFLKSNK